MKKFRSLRKMDNKGMSLVEVLVAMAALSLISVVMLRSFSLAADINNKAKEKQGALTIAEGLMESFKGYDLGAIDKQFGDTVDVSAFTLYGLKATSTKERIGNSYQIHDVAAGGKDYDVVAWITNAANYGTPVVEINKEMHEVDDMNGADDAIISQYANEQFEVWSAIYNELDSDVASLGDPSASFMNYGTSNAYRLIRKEFITITNRTMTVDISSTSATLKSVYSISVNNYPYAKNDGTTGYINKNITVTIDKDTPPADPNNVYSQYEKTNSAGIADVYLYYYPAYSTFSGACLACSDDNIVINNNSGSDKNVYVVKQSDNPFYSSIARDTAEALYTVDVTGTNGNIDLYHNLKKTGFTAYSVSGISNDEEKLWKMSGTTQPLMYDIEINVYKKGTTDLVLSLTGSTNAK